LVAGASGVQIGTANYYNPTVSMQLIDKLPAALSEAGARSVSEIVGTLQTPQDNAKTDAPTLSTVSS